MISYRELFCRLKPSNSCFIGLPCPDNSSLDGALSSTFAQFVYTTSEICSTIVVICSTTLVP